ncbi:hypothetical protein [Schlesneria sp. DSM 10557]|uniref:hypothetical protein n=1 Tax=Schlesneria sp. DSM 10557 TaxID=3044399 RepID=UPI0035A14C47
MAKLSTSWKRCDRLPQAHIRRGLQLAIQSGELAPNMFLAFRMQILPPNHRRPTMNETEASGQLPEFEKWVESLFTESGEELSDEDEDWRLSSQDLAEYYARLFEYPEFLAMKFTREQLAAGIWNICGPHGSWHDAMNPSVPDSIRRRCVRAIGTFYTNLLDPICISVSDDAQETDPLCRAVYMMWDMDGISLLQTYPEFQDDCVSVLWAAINCKSVACVTSGLHGIGHWISIGEGQHDSKLVDWLQACIDAFLVRYRQNVDADPSLIEYAFNARSGTVM